MHVLAETVATVIKVVQRNIRTNMVVQFIRHNSLHISSLSDHGVSKFYGDVDRLKDVTTVPR